MLNAMSTAGTGAALGAAEPQDAERQAPGRDSPVDADAYPVEIMGHGLEDVMLLLGPEHELLRSRARAHQVPAADIMPIYSASIPRDPREKKLEAFCWVLLIPIPLCCLCSGLALECMAWLRGASQSCSNFGAGTIMHMAVLYLFTALNLRVQPRALLDAVHLT